jgi:hypothetical protein
MSGKPKPRKTRDTWELWLRVGFIRPRWRLEGWYTTLAFAKAIARIFPTKQRRIIKKRRPI